MSSEVLRPCIFLVHDIDHGDYKKITDQLELPGTYLLNSYTDLFPEENVHNNIDEIKNKAFSSGDYLIVQDKLLGIGSILVKELFNTTILSSVAQTQYYQFDSDYNVSKIDFDEVCDYVELFSANLIQTGEDVVDKPNEPEVISRYEKFVTEEADAIAGADIFINEFDEPDNLGEVAIKEAEVILTTQEGEN
jgi:hypothetical protein